MLEHLLVLLQRLLGGNFQLLHLLVETVQQLLTHLLQLLAVFLRKVCCQLGDAALQGVDVLLVQAHLLFQLVHQSTELGGQLPHDTEHMLNEQDDKGDGNTVADDGCNIAADRVKTHSQPKGDRAAQLHHGGHAHNEGLQKGAEH